MVVLSGDLGFIEDQSIEENLIQDPCISSNDPSDGNQRSGFDSNETQLGETVASETSNYSLQNTETNASNIFSSKRNSTQF